MWRLNILHIINDGFQASLALLGAFIARDLGLALAQVGALNSLLSVVSVTMALPAGWLALRFGGVRTLVTAVGVCGLVFLGIATGPAFVGLAAMYMLAGVGLGVFHPISFAQIAEWFAKEHRGRIMSEFTAWGDVGRIALSTALPVLAVAIGWRQTALAYGLVAIGLALGFALWLRRGGGVHVKPKAAGGTVSILYLMRHRRTVLAMVASIFDVFSSFSLYIFLPFLLLFRHIDPALLGGFTAIFFIGNLGGKLFLGRLVDRFGSARVLLVSELIMAGVILVLASSSGVVEILVSSLILGAFTKGTTPVVQTMLSEAADHHGDFAKVFGLNTLITRVVNILAPVSLGWLADSQGILWAFYAMAVAAVIAAVPAGLFEASKSNQQN